jgi:Domain of unknown function (DUF4399)
MKKQVMAAIIIATAQSGFALAGETPSAEGAKVSFANIKNGDTVSSPVKLVFSIEGMEIQPAGTDKPNTGHHHVLLDRPALGQGPDGAEELNANIVSDENNIHFGKGQTETSIDLKPGQHTLQLVLGDKDHIPHNKPVASDVITITVQ